MKETSVRFNSYIIEGNHADGFRLEGPHGGVLPLDVYLNHLLKIAIVCGVDEAVSLFETYSCAEGAQGYFQYVASLEGIRIEADIQFVGAYVLSLCLIHCLQFQHGSSDI